MDRAELLRDAGEVLAGRGEPGRLPGGWPELATRYRWARLVSRYGRPALIGLALILILAARSNAAKLGFGVQLVGMLGTAPLALIGWRPLIAWRIAWLAALLSWLAPDTHENSWPWQPTQIFVFLAVLAALAITQRTGVLIGVWLATVPLALAQASPGNGPGIAIFVTLLLGAGDQARRRQRAARRLAEQEERSAVLAERTRIAREMHDVVAHHMSMIAVRAETAPYRLAGLPDPVRDEFGQISGAAREALVEMRRLLGVLRSEREPAPVAPQPGLADLPELVEGVRRSGGAVELRSPGDAAGLPPAAELTVYRIVQEALSNAGRHAPGAAVTVLVERAPGRLTVTVRNHAPRRPPPPGGGRRAAGAGHGLVGMRERATALGGTLDAGVEPDGGFTVHAMLPLPGDAVPGDAVPGNDPPREVPPGDAAPGEAR